MGDTLGVGAMAGLVSDMGASCTVNKQQVTGRHFRRGRGPRREHRARRCLRLAPETARMRGICVGGLAGLACAVSKRGAPRRHGQDHGGGRRPHVCRHAPHQAQGWRVELRPGLRMPPRGQSEVGPGCVDVASPLPLPRARRAAEACQLCL